MKKYADKKKLNIEEYKVGDLVMLSTKDLKYQIIERRMEKLTKRFVGLYKVKKTISTNMVELELPSTVKIHPVVNVSRIHKYVEQVKEQRKEHLAPVIIEGEEEWEVERIPTRYGRYSETGMQRRNVPIERIAGKIYSKKVIWVVR